MNASLKTIQDLLQQNKKLTKADKEALIKAITDADKQWSISKFKLDRTEKVKKTTAILLKETIKELEQKRKAVEAQNRELEIESSLERVRTVAMRMSKADDLLRICEILFKELRILGFTELRNTLIHTFVDEKNYFNDYDFSDFIGGCISRIPYTGHRVVERFIKEIRKNKAAFVETEITGKEMEEWKEFLKTNGEAYDSRLDNTQQLFYYHYSVGAGDIGISTFSSINTEKQNLLRRFRNVFDLAYKRYIDITQAEAQAREAQIEAALEKVRSRSLAMHQSDELEEVIIVVSEQLQQLQFRFHNASFVRYNEQQGLNFWLASPGQPQPYLIEVPYLDNPIYTRPLEALKNGVDFIADVLTPEENHEWLDHLLKYSVLKNVSEDDKKFLRGTAGFARSLVLTNHIILVIGNYGAVPYTDEQNLILKRFGNVFDQAYTRFLDLQKAEAQTREAQIELALERVRAKTMAMHQSAELIEVIEKIYNEFQQFGFNARAADLMIFTPDEKGFDIWISGTMGTEGPYRTSGPLLNHPHHLGTMEAWKRGDSYRITELTGELYTSYFEIILNDTSGFINISDDRKNDIRNSKSIIHTEVFGKHGCIRVASREKRTEAQLDIQKRFARVFEQTYTRFLDLQKAEAQAREAQIEVSLERVRSKAMAMQKSEDLANAVAIVFEELDKLNLGMSRCGIGILNKEKRSADVWTTTKSDNDTVVQVSGDESMDIHPLLQGAFEAWLNQEDHRYVLKGEDLNDYYKAIAGTNFKLPDSQSLVTGTGVQQYYYNAVFSSGGLFAFRETEFPEEAKVVLKRFADVFNLTYTRFSDLKQAEAQAREATIEAALERVRGKAMAMHNSNDLSSTASTIFTELRKLGINPIRCGVGLLNKESRKAQLYSATSSPGGDSLSLIGCVMLTGHPVLEKIYETWAKNEDYFPELSDEQLKSYYELLLAGLSVSVPDWQSGQKQFGHFLPFSVGCLYAWSDTSYNEAEIKILKRFATIIDLTFRRYMELQKSEAIAREAVKQAALDRVRADIASMRTISDLDRITPLIWNELTILGVPFIRCGVFIMDDSQQLIHTFLSTPDGKAIAAFHLPYNTPGNIGQVLSHWHAKKNYIDHWDESAFTEFAGILAKQQTLVSPEQYLKTIPRGGFYLHFLPFLQGMLYVGNSTQLEEEEIKLIQSVADAFSTAYARYEDFNKLEAAKQQVEKTLVDLKQAQTQLVQSEKMASLGELTAGIAHEIQNPLNFVNNFSEVSNELLTEMEQELAKGNYQDAIDIVNDVKKNLEKINHHGKRADGIVKGMLQHSRTSSGQKELADINILADEYLRLCYHGLRAKNKSFNAAIKTDFDETIGNINIIPQDIGRVILNLLTNAFYAASLPPPAGGGFKDPNYKHEPTVWVSTKKAGDMVFISVRDNGPGIPQKILDKIFQPFFTTKPTGQGTGLGLSLSYDIIKAHGGELNVETKEGKGAEFIIQLPVTNKIN